MKLEEIEIGKDYAIGSPNSSYDGARCYRVLKIGKFKKKSWSSRADRRRVKAVRVWEKNGEKHVAEEADVFDARQVLMPWEEKAQERAKERDRKAKFAKAEKEAKKKRLESFYRIGDMMADLSDDLVTPEKRYLPVLDGEGEPVYREIEYEGQTPRVKTEYQETGKMVPGYGLKIDGLSDHSSTVSMDTETFEELLRTLVDAGVPTDTLVELLTR